MIAYDDFLASKERRFDACGVEVEESSLPDWLFPFQKRIVATALRKGRFAVFADTGLGKTRMQLAIAAELAGPGMRLRSLILCPLAVAGQTIAEAESLGLSVGRPGSTADVHVLNYDRLSEVDPSQYGAVLLDESSILKNFSGATKRALCEAFAETRYRFCFTATPAPNDHVEFGNHAEFLGIMPIVSMLSRWFVHDSMDTSEWRIKGHAKDDFWSWVKSWAIALRLPSDIGPFSDDGYVLPPLTIVRHVVQTDAATEGALVHDAALSATTMHHDKRRTSKDRAEKVAEILSAEPGEPWIVWCDTDYEAEDVRALCTSLTEVSGSMASAVKESRLLGFPKGDPRHLLTKPGIASQGLNYQHCARMVTYLSYSFERLYQLMRRCWRFGQTREVVVHVVCADSEWSVIENVEAKRAAHESMLAEMVRALGDQCEEPIGTDGDDAGGNGWRALRGDCVARIADVADESVGYSVFSPPFASLYTYTDLPEDMGNCADDREFFDHFAHLVPEIHRTLMPGRLVSMHCMDLPMTKGRDGEIGLRDFPGELIRLFESHGFVFHSRVTIWKDPLVAMQRTKALGLVHKQLCKDSSMSRQGIADYVVTMRKRGDNPEPITHGNAGFREYIGMDDPGGEYDGDPKSNKRGHYVWQRYASPVWMDIDPGKVLPYVGARSQRDERHICPLQLQVIERCVELWSNPDDLVLSPFMGIGSEGYVSVKAGRRFVGIELKESYFNQSLLNLARAEDEGRGQLDLFAEAA